MDTKPRAIRLYCALGPGLDDIRSSLHTAVWPWLRDLAETRGCLLTVVELRDGAPGNDPDDTILKWAFHEIDRCVPFFVSIVGTDVGFVPKKIPSEAFLYESWITRFKGASISELELRRAMERRSEAFTPRLFLVDRPGDAGGAPTKRREDLAAVARNMGVLVEACEGEPETIAEKIYLDLEHAFAGLLPETLDLAGRDAMDDLAWSRARQGVFVSRRETMDRLTAHADGEQPLLLFLNEPGSGTSALLAAWAEEYERDHPGALVILVHLETPSIDPPDIRIWKRIVGDIKRRIGVSLPFPETNTEWRADGPEWLHLAAAHGRTIVVLDGLHHAADAESVFRIDWLHAPWPAELRFVLAMRPGRSPVELFERRGLPSLVMPQLSRQGRADLIHAWEQALGIELPHVWRERSLAAESTAFPFTAVTLLHETRLLGTSGSAARFLNECISTPDPLAILDIILNRIEQELRDTRCLLVRDTLSLIALSPRGISEERLLEMLASDEDGGRLPQALWQPLRRSLAAFFYELNGRLLLSNEIVTEAVRRRYLLSEAHIRAARQRLIENAFRHGPHVTDWDELAWHLVETGAWESLYRLLSNLAGFDAIAKLPPGTVLRFWQRLEAESPFRLIEAASRILLEPEAWKPYLGTFAAILASAGLWGKAIALQTRHIEHLQTTTDETALWRGREALAEWHMELGEFAHAEGILAALAESPVSGGRDGAARVSLRRAIIAGACGKYDAAVRYCRESRRLFRESNDPFSLEVALGHLASYLYAQSDLGGAMNFYAEQEKTCRSIGRQSGLVRALQGQSMILRAWGDLDSALRLLRESEEICRRLGYRERLADALCQRASIVRTRGRIDLALELYQEAEVICVETSYRDGLQVAIGGQASIRRIRGDLDEAIRLFQEQERLCRLINNKESLPIALCGHAVILCDRGQLGDAMSLLKEAERICREIGYREGLPRILGNAASICRDRGDLDGAIVRLRESERICRDLNLRSGLQRVLEQLALVLKARGELDGALALLKEQEKICRQLGIKIGLQVSLGHQAHILYFRGEVDAAMAMFREQERICRELGLRDRLQIALGGQAVIFRARGDWQRSMELLKEQEGICRELGLRSGLQVSLYNQGIILLIRGDLDGAMTLFKQQEAVCRESGYREGLQAALGSQAVIHRNRGDLDGAMTLFREQERICRESGYKEGLQVSLCGQAVILQARDDVDGALDRLKEGEKICRELGHKEGLQRVLCNMSTIFERRGELDTAMTLLGEVEHICRLIDYKSGLQRALEYMAGIHKTRGDMVMAMKLLKEQEAICRELGIKAGLQACIGRQAQIRQAEGDLESAMQLFREQEAICREMGLKSGLAKALAAQASLMGRKLDRTGEAVTLMKEAWGMARAHGLVSLSDQIATVLDSMQANVAALPGGPECDDIWKKIQNRLIQRVSFMRPDDDPQILLDRLKAHERVSRDLGMQEEVAHSLAGQAYAHRLRREPEKALQKLRDEEKIWRSRDNKTRIAECLTQQALLLANDMNMPREALAPAEEAAKLAASYELLELSGDVLARLLEHIRASLR